MAREAVGGGDNRHPRVRAVVYHHIQTAPYSPFNSTLKSIQEFVEEKVERNVLLRVIGSTADVGKIKEYRENLQQAVNQFTVSNLIHE